MLITFSSASPYIPDQENCANSDVPGLKARETEMTNSVNGIISCALNFERRVHGAELGAGL